MPPGLNTSIKWSMLELRGLLEDEETRVYFQRAKRHLGLHPFHLNDLNRALREILDSSVNSYDTELQCLVLAYKAPKLLSPLGAIFHDSHFIHIDIEADFYIFKPEIGCILKGIANKKAVNHVGVLVHKAFNVSIPKPENSDEWPGDYVFVGQEIKFTVTHMDFKGKLPFIRGELISDGISRSMCNTEDLGLTSAQEERKEAFISDAVVPNGVDCESKKKRSKRSSVFDTSGDETSDGEDKSKVAKKHDSKIGSKKSDEPRIGKLKAETLKNRRKIFDSSSDESSEEEQCNVKSKEVHRRQRVSSESSKSEDETRRKIKTQVSPEKISKENGSPNTSIESRESPDRKPQLKSLNVEKSAKKKPSKKAENSDTCVESDKSLDVTPKAKSLKLGKSAKKNGSNNDGTSDTSIETEKSIDGTSEAESLRVTKSAKKRRSKEDGSLNTNIKREKSFDGKPIEGALNVKKCGTKKSPEKNGKPESCSESEELIDRKPKIDVSLNVEKVRKNKHKKVASTSSPLEESSEDHHDREDVISPKKRSKTNKINDSDNEDAREVVIKPEIETKKRTKSKKHKEEAHESQLDEETAGNTSQNVSNTFEFIEPEIKPHKRKRRKTITENEESAVASQSGVLKNEEVTSNFFRDVRIKAEPDPSDIEDAAAPREKSAKRKRKLSIKEEDRTRNNDASHDESSFRPVGIKIEPEASDVEDTNSRKRKSKKKISEKELFENVKIKVEQNASDVEDSKPKRKFKSEPQDNKVKIRDSTAKREIMVFKE